MGLNPILIEYAKATLQKEASSSAARNARRVQGKNAPPAKAAPEKPAIPMRTGPAKSTSTAAPAAGKGEFEQRLPAKSAPAPKPEAAPAAQQPAPQPAPQPAAPAPAQPAAAPAPAQAPAAPAAEPIAQSAGATMPPALMHQLQQWVINNPELAAAAGIGTAGLGVLGASSMGGGQAKQEVQKAAEYTGGRLNPHMVKLARAILEKKADLDPAINLTGAGLLGAGHGASLAVLAGNVYHAPQGHKAEGFGRGVVNSALTNAGVGLGGAVGGGLLSALSRNPKTQAMLLGGGAVLGGVAGGMGGNSLGNHLLGKPTWERKAEKAR